MSTDTKPAVTTYVRYLYPGAFFSEDSAHAVSGRDPARVAREAPDGVFAFELYDVAAMTVTIGGEQVEMKSRVLHKTGRYYINAEKLTAADVEALPGDHRVLADNMRCNGWDIMLRCRTGNYQPLQEGDEVVSTVG
jgi:hypothetical protein